MARDYEYEGGKNSGANTAQNPLAFGIFDALTIKLDGSKFKALTDQLLHYSQIFLPTYLR